MTPVQRSDRLMIGRAGRTLAVCNAPPREGFSFTTFPGMPDNRLTRVPQEGFLANRNTIYALREEK
jgi:hypothetical protein